MIWDRKHETMPRGELEGLQLERLQRKWARSTNSSRSTGRALEQGVTPQAIRSLADLAKLPFTYKTDFRDNYPLACSPCPKNDRARPRLQRDDRQAHGRRLHRRTTSTSGPT